MTHAPSPEGETLTPAGYLSRVADPTVAECLGSVGAVLIEGPKGCGKTWSALRHAASVVRFDAEPIARRLTTVSPQAVLRGEAPRLLDEWQLAPDVWNHVRHACDQSSEPGRFLLTGSAVPTDDIARHSGAGRIARVRLRPMSLFESGLSGGSVSLGDLLLSGMPETSEAGVATFHDVIEAMCVGGWPWLLKQPPRIAGNRLREYLDEIRRLDINGGNGRGRNPVLVEKLILSLARNTSTTAPNSRLAHDADSERPLNHQTVRAYLDALTRLFVLEDLPAWSPHLRSRGRLTKSPKRHMVDPSLAAAALRAGPEALMADLGACGLLFESLVVRDLRIYGDANECDIYHCRLDNGVEADAVIRRRYSGEWIAVEAKLAGNPDTVDAAAGSLLRFAGSVDTAKAGPPVALLVVTSTGYAYARPDGVAVVPITALGP